MAWSILHFDSQYSLGIFDLCPLAVLSLNNALHCMNGLSYWEKVLWLTKPVCLCVNGESVQTGSAAWSISIIQKKPMKCHRPWHLKMPGWIEQQCGKMKYLNQVLMWTSDADLAASRLLIIAACLKFKHAAQIPLWQLLTDRYSEGYSLMAPDRVPMASSCRVGL